MSDGQNPPVPVLGPGVRGSVGAAVDRPGPPGRGSRLLDPVHDRPLLRPGSISEASGHRPVDVAPLTAMTAAAMATTSCGSAAVCSASTITIRSSWPRRLATLDMLSEGRVEAGLGAGWVAAEYEGLGIAMDRPGRADRAAGGNRGAARGALGGRAARHQAHVRPGVRLRRAAAAGAAAAPADLHRRRRAAGAAAGRPAGRHREHQLQQRGREARGGQRGQLDPGGDRGEDRLDPGGRRRPVRRHRA